MIEVRRATDDDAAAIIRFNSAMAIETEDVALDGETLTRGVRRMLADPQLGFYLVAEHDGAVAGCLGITYEWSDWRAGLFWWIQSVYVEPGHRASGVFTALYEQATRDACATPEVIGLRLYAERDNDRAIRTYHRLGMTTTHYRLLEILW